MDDKRAAELYRHMLGVAEANGFESITDAITQAVQRRVESETPSLRDTFAAAALARIPSDYSDANAAEAAYRMADAMLAAREAK